MAAARPAREKPPATWELVLKRNPVERIKQEKAPLGIRDELPALIAAGYESVPEEDIVRLQWWGLYHDKPKIGTFMLRISRDMGVFVPKAEAVEVLAAITSAWSEDLRYRVSRVKARLKFMIDDIGAEGMRERAEAKLGRRLEDFTLPPPEVQPSDHIGVHEQKQPGLRYIGVPVHLGLVSGDQMIAIGDLAERLGGDIRITRQQNFILANVPGAEVDAALDELAQIGFSLDVNHVRAASIACTGEPHCNFSVTETKSRLGELIERLEERFGADIAPLRLQLDGCPHSRGQPRG